MQIANVWLKISEQGNQVLLKRVTPAECQVLRRDFGIKVAGTNQLTNPFNHVDVLKEDVERDNNTEFGRLVQKYGQKKVESAFPGENPKIPVTFKEANVVGMDAEPPKAGKYHDIPPLTEKPDSGEDMEETKATNNEVAALKKQIEELKALVTSKPAAPASDKK